MAKQKKNHAVMQEPKNIRGRELEYTMTRQMFDDLTKDCKGDKYQFAMDYINQTYGLLGTVTSLVLEDSKIQIAPIAVME